MTSEPTRRRNPTLAWAMDVLDLSTERLARTINRELATLGQPRRVSKSSPAQWRDQNMVPRPPIPALTAHVLAQALDRPLSVNELWQGRAHDPQLIVPADFGLDHPWTPTGTVEILHTVRSDRMLRRQFLTIGGLALTGPAMEWADTPAAPLIAAAHGDRVTPESIELVETNITGLRRLDDAGSGTHALDATENQLALVIQLLSNGRYDSRMATRLHTALANLAQLAGYISQDVGDDPRGQRYFLTALHAAHSADDRSLAARILTCMSSMASRHGQTREALVLIESAQRGVRSALTPALQAMLAYKEARLHAELKDESGCGNALNLAEKLLDRSRQEDEPAWLYWLVDSPESRMSAAAGNCYASLGQGHLGRAERYLRRGIVTLGPRYLRDRAIDLPTLANVQRRRGELDAACATATEALKLCEQTGTERGRSALRAFRANLPTTTRTPAITDFLTLSREPLTAA